MWPEALEDAGHGIQGQGHGPVSTVTAEVWSSLFWALLFFLGVVSIRLCLFNSQAPRSGMFCWLH